jgi:hypothetical protein
MSRPILRDTIYKQQDRTDERVDVIERFGSTTPVAINVDTTGLSSAAIDALLEATPRDGAIIVDSVNKRILVRLDGRWYSTGVLTLIP